MERICGCCCSTIEVYPDHDSQVDDDKTLCDNDQVRNRKVSEVEQIPIGSDDIAANKENSSSVRKTTTTVAEKLAFLFEYPHVIREEKTIFSTIGAIEEFTFCGKCFQSLCQLHSMYEQFTKLLQNESRVLRTLQTIGNEPVLPSLAYASGSRSGKYDTNLINVSPRHKSVVSNRKKHVRRSLKTTTEGVHTTRTSVKLNSSPFHLRTQKALQNAETSFAYKETLFDLDSQSEVGSLEEMVDPLALDISDDNTNDPTFSPFNPKKRKRLPSELKSETKRRGRRSRPVEEQSSTIMGTSEGGTEDCSNNQSSNDVEPPKRKRCLKKECWIEKAKSDPNRTCDICHKVFLYARMMKHHQITVHEGKKPYECQNCGRCFTQNFILKKHTCDYRLAGGDREYLKMAREQELFKWECEICAKRFKERSSLAVHQMNHAGEKFQCEKCEKTFRRPDHLKTHIKIVHSEEKKFVCSTCGQKFKTSSNLRAHERKHANPEQKHLCNICGKSIRTLSQMSRHQKTHEDALPYACHICGKKFKMKDYLGQHLRKGKSCSGKQNKVSNLTNNDRQSGNLNDTQDFQQLQQFPGGESEALSPTMEFPAYTIPVALSGNLTRL